MHRDKNYLIFFCNSPCPFLLTIHFCQLCIAELIYIINWYRWIFNYIIRSVDNSWRGVAPAAYIAVYWLVFVKLFEHWKRISQEIILLYSQMKYLICFIGRKGLIVWTQKSSDDIQKQLPSMLCVLYSTMHTKKRCIFDQILLVKNKYIMLTFIWLSFIFRQ